MQRTSSRTGDSGRDAATHSHFRSCVPCRFPRQARFRSHSPSGPADSGEPESQESPEHAQLNYANGLLARKLYDLAIPEYEKFLGLYPDSPDRASALFYLGEAYRALNRTTAARTSFQTVLEDFPESEFAGPASYGLAEIFFNEKDYAVALPLFHRAAAKVKATDACSFRALLRSALS